MPDRNLHMAGFGYRVYLVGKVANRHQGTDTLASVSSIMPEHPLGPPQQQFAGQEAPARFFASRIAVSSSTHSRHAHGHVGGREG